VNRLGSRVETGYRILRLLVNDDRAGSSRLMREVNSYFQRNLERLNATFCSRIRLKEKSCAALIDWLGRTGWESGLAARPALCIGVRRVLERLARRREYRDTPSELQAASLVARYLIYIQATGVDTRDRLAVSKATSESDPVQLPAYWPRPPWSNARCWRRATAEDCTRFKDNFDRFWSDKNWCRAGRRKIKSSRSRPGEGLHGALERFGYKGPSLRQRKHLRIIRDEVGGTTEPIVLSRRQAVAHMHLANYAAQLVPDHRPLLPGLKILAAGLALRTAVHAGAVSIVLDQLSEHLPAAREETLTLLNCSDAEDLISDETTCLELPGISALPLPTPDRWRGFHAASAGFEPSSSKLDPWKR
jgi:hypothetical protein